MTDNEAADALEKIYKCNMTDRKCDWKCEACEWGVDNSEAFPAYERAIEILRHGEKTDELNRLIKSVTILIDELTEEIRYRQRKYH